MKYGILLDVDGTLWNSVVSVTESWNIYRHKAIPEMPGFFTQEELFGVFGKTMTEIADLLLKDLPPARREEAMNGMMDYEVEYLHEHGGVVYPGVADTFQKLKGEGYHLCIVSNCQKGYIEDFLCNSGTEDLVEDHVCFGDTLQPKDFSMRLCVERNALDRAVYVGDTAGDLSAARKAGLPFIYASYGFGDVDPEKEKVASIAHITELPEAVGKLWG